jgi:hypothetical protein
MQATATAMERKSTEGPSCPRVGQPQPERRSDLPHFLRWLYAARPSLTPTVYVPGPVVVAHRV